MDMLESYFIFPELEKESKNTNDTNAEQYSLLLLWIMSFPAETFALTKPLLCKFISLHKITQ